MEQPTGDAAPSLPPMNEPGHENEPQNEPEPPMGDDMGPGEPTGKVQELMDTASQISEKDQDTLLAYARSLKDASEEAAAGAAGGPEMGPDMPGAPTQPMQESVVFTKKQLRHINENMVNSGELDREKELGHTTKLKADKNKEVSPIDPPRKNRK